MWTAKDMPNLMGKTVIVTGANTGLGFETALAFYKAGAYYQTMRMKEAASLLQTKQLSVSEVSYALGFSNLSHFSRVFEEHIGMKPKKFSAS